MGRNEISKALHFTILSGCSRPIHREIAAIVDVLVEMKMLHSLRAQLGNPGAPVVENAAPEVHQSELGCVLVGQDDSRIGANRHSLS